MKDKSNEKNAFGTILSYLPPACRFSVESALNKRDIDDNEITEIRLRVGRRTVIRVLDKSFGCSYVMSAEDMRYTVKALCSGTVYAYQNTIKNGYIPMPIGGRAGVVGVISNENTAVAPETVTAINIRIPHHIRGVCSEIYDLFCKTGRGIVIYSPPSVGKTTLLRDLAIELSRGEKGYNVALIDTRRELDNGMIPSDCMIDTYSGYPKSLAIEIAARTMSSELIICDELSYDEVEAMRYTVVASIPVIACAHARDLAELCTRPDIKMLIDAGVFEYAVGIKRVRGAGSFNFIKDKLR